MTDEQKAKADANQQMVYQIRIKGHLSQQWVVWFEDLTITLEADGNTLLSGPVVDQSALHGLLKKVRDLGLPLLSVNRVEPVLAESSLTRPSTDETRGYGQGDNP